MLIASKLHRYMAAADLLAATETAITQCLTAQDYSISGRQKRMADLKELRAFRQQLIDEINNAGPMLQVAVQTQPSHV